MGNSQRIGSTSNSRVGSDFEAQARAFFLTQGIALEEHVSLEIGVEEKKKQHKFDLGSTNPKIILECKSHTWTEGDNTPSAKMTTWTEAMYYFHVAPRDYRKVFFVLKAFSARHRETLASYYLRTYEHLIPADVEFWEYDPEKGAARRLR